MTPERARKRGESQGAGEAGLVQQMGADVRLPRIGHKVRLRITPIAPQPLGVGLGDLPPWDLRPEDGLGQQQVRQRDGVELDRLVIELTTGLERFVVREDRLDQR